MHPNPTPPAGLPPASIQAELQAKTALINHLVEISSCTITKLTIVVKGRNGKEAVNKVLTFPPGQVPPEFLQFLESYSNTVAAEKMALQSNQVLIKIGSSRIVLLEDFIKDYTAGEIPSMNADDAAKLQALQYGETAIIQINELPLQVQRIS